MEELHLNEFKAVYMVLKRGVPWLDHLILGLLVWLEEKLLQYRIKYEVDKAVRGYQEALEGLDDGPKAIYTEQPVNEALQPGESALLGGEMRVSAPWYRPEK